MPKKKKGSGSGSKFGKLFGGAIGAGFDNDQAAAMAYKKLHESQDPGAKLRQFHESLQRRFKQRGK